MRRAKATTNSIDLVAGLKDGKRSSYGGQPTSWDNAKVEPPNRIYIYIYNVYIEKTQIILW